MKRTFILPALLVLITAASAWSQENTTVNWTNFTFDGPTQTAILFRDGAGVALSDGPTTGNNDGMLIQLGYYTGAISANNNFDGTWTPITGFGTTFRTSIGDAGSGNGSGDGIGDFTTLFGGALLNTPTAQVYPAAPATYVTNSSVSITTSTPPNGVILSIRFYDTTTGTTGHYNAVSDNSWLWQSPTLTGGGASFNLFLESSFNAGTLLFEDSLNPFKTTILIPEPSTFALLGVGALGLVAARRRRAKK